MKNPRKPRQILRSRGQVFAQARQGPAKRFDFGHINSPWPAETRRLIAWLERAAKWQEAGR